MSNSSNNNSSPLPSHFNPFATHRFTNYSTPSSSPTDRSFSQPIPPRSSPTLPSHPPTKSTAPKHVFEPFRQGAASPDLYDILKKKPQPTTAPSKK
ncbi:hypothetical protein GYMLUDRAFT_42539 [Collybiopsis luxurians FD-317 M1]|uniref:Unplaced genomic scaffold GYMLUscaffold_22, whole genome shotgun sequence n=1 Tax=Collybiopsis luxurians FD-317 M1 TaxID=944289 RepID=A0A0D0CYS0_9AGAR|nr:hypothetical protein GYMLUDRAFT_42539 [Collybiopsis luxurians FD-317 M1]